MWACGFGIWISLFRGGCVPGSTETEFEHGDENTMFVVCLGTLCTEDMSR